MAKDANYTKTPQSGSKPSYVEPIYSKTAQTISQKLRNNKGSPNGTDVVFPGNGTSPGGGSTSAKGKKQGD